MTEFNEKILVALDGSEKAMRDYEIYDCTGGDESGNLPGHSQQSV